MSNLIIKTREFVSNQEGSLCDTFIYSPINVEEADLGTLLILGETTIPHPYNKDTKAKKNHDTEYPYIINQVASQAKKEHYKNYKRDAHKSFEETLRKANLFLSKTASEKKFFNPQWTGFIIAVYTNQNLYFSASEKPKIFLLREKRLLEITKKLPIGENFSTSKMFANFASGRLVKGDIVLLVNSHFTEIFSNTALETMLSNNAFEKSYEYISETMRKDKDNASGLIMLEVTEEKNIPVVRYSYEELRKISDEPASHSDAETKNEQPAPSLNTNKATLKSLYYVKKTATKFTAWFRNNIIPGAKNALKSLLKNDILKNILAYVAKNRKKIIIISITILIITVLIFYSLNKEATYLIK